MYDLIKAIKENGGKLFLLSNISYTFAKNWQNTEQLADLFSLFDGLVFSAEAGKIKPNADIFQHLLYKYNLAADDTIFIDDNINNVNGAKAVGVDAYLFDGNAEKLRKNII